MLLHPVVCAAPLCFRLRDHPTLAAALLLAAGSIFKPAATLGDGALCLSLAALSFDAFADAARASLADADDATRALRTKLVEAAVFLVATGVPLVGANVALYLWQVSAVGNANFWYFLGLAHSFSWAVLLCKTLAWFLPHRPGKPRGAAPRPPASSNAS